MEITKKIEQALGNIRPALQMDGGDVEFVKFEDSVVYVKLLGACGGCPMSTMTLKLFIEERMREEVPEVSEVVSV
ncbi:MAG: NifU family protein [Holophagae bacterium]|nr:NifU family protein [Holophagae bacterium]